MNFVTHRGLVQNLTVSYPQLMAPTHIYYYTIISTSTSPSKIADYTVALVYSCATILLYLPLLHRLKLRILSLYWYIAMLLYCYTYPYFTVWNCWFYRYISILLCHSTIILTSTSPSEIADYTVALVYSCATILLYLPLLHRLKLLIIPLH